MIVPKKISLERVLTVKLFHLLPLSLRQWYFACVREKRAGAN